MDMRGRLARRLPCSCPTRRLPRRSRRESACCAPAASWPLWTSTPTGAPATGRCSCLLFGNGPRRHALALIIDPNPLRVLWLTRRWQMHGSGAAAATKPPCAGVRRPQTPPIQPGQPISVAPLSTPHCSSAGRNMPPAVATLMKATEPWTDEVRLAVGLFAFRAAGWQVAARWLLAGLLVGVSCACGCLCCRLLHALDGTILYMCYITFSPAVLLLPAGGGDGRGGLQARAVPGAGPAPPHRAGSQAVEAPHTQAPAACKGSLQAVAR